MNSTHLSLRYVLRYVLYTLQVCLTNILNWLKHWLHTYKCYKNPYNVKWMLNFTSHRCSPRHLSIFRASTECKLATDFTPKPERASTFPVPQQAVSQEQTAQVTYYTVPINPYFSSLYKLCLKIIITKVKTAARDGFVIEQGASFEDNTENKAISICT